MWSAIKSDLFDFVATIQEDTSKTLNKVMGEEEEEEEEVTIREKMVADARRSFQTYSTPIEEQYEREFEKYMKKFSLSSEAAEIAEILDVEPDVSRYYADLVPSQIKPEDFWGRYFFRVSVIMRGGAINLDDDDDEEELVWDSGDKEEVVGETTDSSTKNSSFADDKAAISEEENAKLRNQIKTLTNRITELEKIVQEKDRALAAAQREIKKLTQSQSTDGLFVDADTGSVRSETSEVSEGSGVVIGARDLPHSSQGSLSNPSPTLEAARSSEHIEVKVEVSAPKTPEKWVSVKAAAPLPPPEERGHVEVSTNANQEDKEVTISRGKSGVPVAALAALDGDDDEDDGWS